jgi:hypothetical protein
MRPTHRRRIVALLATLVVVTAVVPVQAQAGTAASLPERITGGNGIGDDGSIGAQVTDGIHTYVGTYGSPARIVKFRLTDMARVRSLTLAAGESGVTSAITDSTFGYFGVRTSPAIIVKVRLSDMARVSSVTLNEGEDVPSTAVTDGTFGYFGTDTRPGRVVKVRLSDMTRVGAVTLNAGDSNLRSAATDGVFGYFGTGTSTGRLVKVRLSDLERVGALTLQSGEDGVASAITDGTHVYLGTSTVPGRIVKVRMADLTRVDSLTLDSGEDYISGSVSDGTFGYFGTFTGPGKIVKVRLADLDRIGALTLPESDLGGVGAITKDASQAYLGLLDDPVAVVKVRLAPDATSSCGFTDEAAIPAYARVGACWLKSNGITVNNPYGPVDNVTRAQMAAFLWRAAGSPPAPSACGFIDEAAIPGYARPGACWLKATGVTVNNPYGPADNVTRAQMAAFLWRAAGSPAAASSCGFIDGAAIPGYARPGACWLKATGVTVNNPYGPADNVTRAQMAAFINRQHTLPLP